MLVPCLLVFLVLNHYTPIIFSVPFYQPIEDYVILCGSSLNPYNDPTNQNGNRSYTGDTNSNNSDLFSLLDSSSSSIISNPSSLPPSVVSPIFYGSARLSHSEFTYSFTSLTHGPKFLRLHFFPASYSNFQSYNALFSVKSNNFTLLKDFNVSAFAAREGGGDGTVSREYCIHVEPGERLNVTFTPTTNNNSDAYAFINAIEVVSMPDYLYYTNTTEKTGLPVLGDLQNYPEPRTISYSTAMQLEYRAYVGAGKDLGSDEDDTGMSRYWTDDLNFLESVSTNSLPYDWGDSLVYSKIKNYTAPSKVYRNARSYGHEDKDRSSLRNVTWNFPVVSAFDYFVRLHFCEIDPNVTAVGDRVFQIFVAESLAEVNADVFRWTGNRLVPCYKQYVVKFLGTLDRKLNLSIKLQPHPNIDARRYDDVLLNGVEIFRLSDSSNNLAEPNLNPPGSPSSPSPSPPVKSSKKPSMLGIVIGSASGSIILVSLIIGFIIFRRQKLRAKENNYTKSKSLPSDLCRCFSIAEIKAATNNFDEVFKVGVGGFGHVYKGYINIDHDRMVPVAIKRLKPGSQQGVLEFQTEINMLSQLRHIHLVSLIGYCNDGDEMILVYEFMARGTLRDHLYGSDNNNNEPLSWKQRLEISVGAARGLSYLHTGAKYNIIHRDVKTTNILIDEKWVAKVSDFGLSKIGPTGMSTSHISTVVKGSVGYLDPEYYKRQRLTQKSDVYSFGVVLLEVLCGRAPLDRTVEKQKANLVGWVRKCHQEGMIHETVDPLVIESVTPECLKVFIDMVLKCLMDDGNERPSMNDVVWGLEFALEVQKSTEERGLNDEEKSYLSRKDKIDEENEMMAFTSREETESESHSSKMAFSSSSEEQALVATMSQRP